MPARDQRASRPTGAPAYYLARPASLWLSVTGPTRQVRRTQAAADDVTGSCER